MKTQFFMLISVFPLFIFAQAELDKMDTVKIHNWTYSIIRIGDTTMYEVNKKPATKEEADKIADEFKQRKKCNPCYFQELNSENKVISEGILYMNCPGEVPEKKTTLESQNQKTVVQSSNYCKFGQWKYYTKKGKLKKIENYGNGKPIKHLP